MGHRIVIESGMQVPTSQAGYLDQCQCKDNSVLQTSAQLKRVSWWRERERKREMLAVWIVSVLALFACVAYAKEEEFNVFSTLRKSNFSVNLSKW